ncbi:MAG: leucyl aminopeptidase, partial [Defluviitaleaceae bacterium]|nr:leucyl aminopeptidase [Defluviitaleaceae bacterium]
SVLITVDSVSDFRPTEEFAKMAEALGAKVMVAWHSTPVGYGALTMPYLPEPLKACVDKTDVWVEMNDQWLLYSPIWDAAVTNGRTRQIMLGGLGIEVIARCIGNVDIPALKDFQDALTAMTQQATSVRITNASGTDVSFDMCKVRKVNSEMLADTPGPHFVIGQIGWCPDEESINGVIAFDGTISGGGEAELGRLEQPVSYVVEKGVIKEIKGGWQADKLRNYFEKLNDPEMYKVAHVCYGVNPGAKLEGCTTEDERVWGCTQWGFGHQGPSFTKDGKPRAAVSHIDGICLGSTVYLDGVKILDSGVYIEPGLKELAAKLGK